MKERYFGGFKKSGIVAHGSSVFHVTRGSKKLESCLGVSKEIGAKVAEVGVLVGVGGCPPSVKLD